MSPRLPVPSPRMRRRALGPRRSERHCTVFASKDADLVAELQAMRLRARQDAGT